MKEKFIIYSWMDQSYISPLDHIIQVLDVDHMVKTSREELKITTYKNKNLPIIDPVSLLTIGQTKVTKQAKILVVTSNNIKFGILVEKIIGIESLDTSLLRDPSLKENRFVKKTLEKYKMVDFQLFLTSNLIELIKQAYNLPISNVMNGQEYAKAFWSERDAVLNELKLKSLNLIIRSNEKKIDDSYISDMLNIHKIIERI